MSGLENGRQEKRDEAMDSEADTRKISTRSRHRSSVRNPRGDGDVTRKRIIEAAGQLFSAKGFADTTSKEICEAIPTNIAAVNYYFGSREGLYREVLETVGDYLLNAESLNALVNSRMSPEEKLNAFIDAMTTPVFNRKSWQVRLWARELLSPSPQWCEMQEKNSGQKFTLLAQVIAEVTGIPAGHPLVDCCLLNTIAPFMVLLVTGRSGGGPCKSLFAWPVEQLIARQKTIIRAGLDAMAASYAASTAAP